MSINKIYTRVFHNKNLSLLFAGQLISQMGDSMFMIGLMWLVLELTGSKAMMGTVALLNYLPMLVVGLFAGVIVDLYDHKKLMLISDFVRAVIVLVIPLCYYMGWINITIILIVAFLLSSFSTVFNPARDSIIPKLIDDGNLVKANSVIQVSNYTAVLLGPAIAAAAIGVFGVVHLFTADSVTFMISFFTVLFISYKKSPVENLNKNSIMFHLSEIVRYIHNQKKTRFLLALTAVNNFFIMGPAIVGIPIFVKEVLKEGASTYALVESSYGIGMFVGGVLINYLKNIIGKGKILLIGLMFDGFTYTLIYFIGSSELMMLLIAFHAIGIPLIVVSRTSLIQEWTDDTKIGRVFSLVNMAVVGMTALTTGITGILAEIVPVEMIFGLFGIGGMVCGFIGWMYRELREG